MIVFKNGLVAIGNRVDIFFHLVKHTDFSQRHPGKTDLFIQ